MASRGILCGPGCCSADIWVHTCPSSSLTFRLQDRLLDQMNLPNPLHLPPGSYFQGVEVGCCVVQTLHSLISLLLFSLCRKNTKQERRPGYTCLAFSDCQIFSSVKWQALPVCCWIFSEFIQQYDRLTKCCYFRSLRSNGWTFRDQGLRAWWKLLRASSSLVIFSSSSLAWDRQTLSFDPFISLCLDVFIHPRNRGCHLPPGNWENGWSTDRSAWHAQGA